MTTLADIQRRVGVTPDGVWGPATAAAIWKALPAPPARTLKTPETFFAGVRSVTGPLDTMQVRIINALLTAASGWSVAWLAYGMATAWHEALFRPIAEFGKGAGKAYGKPGKHAGQIAFGRGLVQLTWDYNYAKADDELKLGGALIRDYSKALDPDIAVAILVRGMTEGWFTSRKLADYLPAPLATVPQFKEARRIINGTDKADLIAGYARKFQDALVTGGWS